MFIFQLEFSYSDDSENNRIVIYMIHNTDKHTLYPCALLMDEDGSLNAYSTEEAKEFVEMVYDGTLFS